MKIANKIISLMLFSSLCLSLTGCDGLSSNKKNENTVDVKTIELRQNDYRGGVIRTQTLQDAVLKVMENMKANNSTVRGTNPNSFWTADGYQDIVSTFLDIPIINDTRLFNEEEVSWADVCDKLSTTANSFTKASSDTYSLASGVEIVRNEKDDYSVLNVNDSIMVNNSIMSGKVNYRILYDCDKDWCKAYTLLPIVEGLPDITTQMFEYQRLNNDTFVIQTSRERLMVVLAPAEADVDIRSREIKEFYYSKLVMNGQRTTFAPYQPAEELFDDGTVNREAEKQNEVMAAYPEVNNNGDISLRYGVNDSMFLHTAEPITRDWVFEDKALQQGIAYKDGVLVVTTYNKLSTNYERFIYSLVGTDAKIAEELENVVVIENLVGIVTHKTEVKEEIPETTAATNEASAIDGTVPDSTISSEPVQSSANAEAGAPAESTPLTNEEPADTQPADTTSTPQMEGQE